MYKTILKTLQAKICYLTDSEKELVFNIINDEDNFANDIATKISEMDAFEGFDRDKIYDVVMDCFH